MSDWQKHPYFYSYLLMGVDEVAEFYKHLPDQTLSNDDFIQDCLDFQKDKSGRPKRPKELGFISSYEGYEILISECVLYDDDNKIDYDGHFPQDAYKRIVRMLKSYDYREYQTPSGIKLVLPIVREWKCEPINTTRPEIK